MTAKPVPGPVPARSVPKIVPTCSRILHFRRSDLFPACSVPVPTTIAADLFPPTPSREGTGNRSGITRPDQGANMQNPKITAILVEIKHTLRQIVNVKGD